MWMILPAVGLACYALEFVRPVVPRPKIRSWVWRVWSINLVQVPIVIATTLMWRTMAKGPSLFDLSHTHSAFIAGVAGYLAYTLVFYWWHRLRHASDFIWRTLHQIHHSPVRLELVTAFYKHPLETLANAMLGATLLFPVLGLDVGAALSVVVLAALADMFYHANMRTPRWVALLVQRPEMHRLHHEHERHEGNYGDLPLWDWLFGTLRLPESVPVRCGFDRNREEMLLPMMRFVDLHRDEATTDAVRSQIGALLPSRREH